MTQSQLFVLLGFSLALILLVFMMLVLLTRMQNQAMAPLQETNRQLLSQLTTLQNLLQSKDPMTYQQLQAMNLSSNSSSENGSMSDANEYARWVEANGFTEELGEPVYDPDGTAAAQQLFGARDS